MALTEKEWATINEIRESVNTIKATMTVTCPEHARELERHRKTLFGNGHKGLTERVSGLWWLVTIVGIPTALAALATALRVWFEQPT